MLNCGCCFEQSEQEIRNEEIELLLKKERSNKKAEFNLLLLGIFMRNRKYNQQNKQISGTGESGKSTFIKQMKIIHGGGYSDEEKINYRQLIFKNTFMSIRAIIKSLQQLGIQIDSLECQVFFPSEKMYH